MLRVPLTKAWIKRTLRVKYGWVQTTPKDVKVDPAWDRSVAIYPGMVAMKTKGDLVSLVGGAAATVVPYGLFGEYIGGDGLDEPLARGVNSTAVWVLGPDAEFEVLSPAFDTGATWTDPADGTVRLIHTYVDGANRGKMAPAGTTGRGTLTTKPIAKLIRVDSAAMIVVGGLSANET
jgi:hypothetical protein